MKEQWTKSFEKKNGSDAGKPYGMNNEWFQIYIYRKVDLGKQKIPK